MAVSVFCSASRGEHSLSPFSAFGYGRRAQGVDQRRDGGSRSRVGVECMAISVVGGG
jgi:hypothetical protein